VQAIRMFPEYKCYPLWRQGADSMSKNIDPGTLPISETLRAEIMSWSDEFDAIFGDAPSSSATFETREEDVAFAERGRIIATRLQQELGSDWRVSFEYAPD
jgi:hypothetical protein